MKAKVFVVVPVFNRRHYTEAFLRCMRKQTFENFQIIVVDDGSTDGTSEMISQHFKEVQLLGGNGNLWWTGAINVGIRHAMLQAAETDAVLVINNDLEVDPDYLEILHGLYQSMPKTLIGSVVVDIDNTNCIDNGGVVINWLTAKHRVLNRNKYLSDFNENYYVDVSYLTGRGVLIPVQVFQAIGLYDEKHFQQCGDIDLPVRAKNAGYRLIVSYAAVVKSHIKGTYDINRLESYSLKYLKSYFFDIKSNFRLKYRFFFAYNTARNPIYFISFFVCDILRISYHFFSRVRL